MNAPTVAPVTTQEKQAQYAALVARFADLSESEEKELLKLKKELKTIKEQRGGEIDKLKAKIDELGASLSELFNNEELKKLVTDAKYAIADLFTAQQIADLKPRKNTKVNVPGEVTTRTKHEYPSDKNDVLFHFPKSGTRGDRAYAYHLGRIYESYKGEDGKAPFIPAPAKLQAHAISIEELVKFLPTDAEAHAKAVAHLNTPDVAKEVAKLISFVTGEDVTFDKVSADLKTYLKADKKAEQKKAA